MEITPETIRKSIERSGETQAEYAHSMGISQSTLTRWLNGSRTPRGLYRKALIKKMKKIGG